MPVDFICSFCGSLFRRPPSHRGVFCSPQCGWDSQRAQMRPLSERFWEHVPTGNFDSCWEWQGIRHPRDRYGLITLKRKTLRANRVSYLVCWGVDPGDLSVLHRCDNPPCVNPFHLFLGTPRDNTDDAYRKGRLAHGERVGTSKLTEAQVVEILSRYRAGGVLQTTLAAEFGVTKNLINQIVHRKAWRHLAAPEG